jgi:metal-responsive CopG/Arc/MetJ family transcriptional regulator
MSDVVQVNVSMESETATQLDQMAREMGYDNRSAFVRWLIRQEWNRQHPQISVNYVYGKTEISVKGENPQENHQPKRPGY